MHNRQGGVSTQPCGTARTPRNNISSPRHGDWIPLLLALLLLPMAGCSVLKNEPAACPTLGQERFLGERTYLQGG